MAKKKRGNGEGSLYQRSDGTWAGQVTIGINPKTGKPKRATYYGKTRKDVAKKIADALAKLQTGSFVEPNQVTVGQWLDRWMEVYQTEISPNFYARRKDLIRLHIKPTLGNIPLMKLKPADVKELYNKLGKSGKKSITKAKDESGNITLQETYIGLATGTIRHIHNVLNPAMKQAVKEGLAVKNVVADVSPPRLVKSRETRSLTKVEAGKYLRTLKEHRLYAAFLLELTTGLRRGELLGLQWQDLDIETGVLKIRRQINRIKHQDETTSLEYCSLKTPASYRTIVLPAIALKVLKSYKAKQSGEKLLAGDAYNNEDLIFCTVLGEKLDTRHLYRLHCKALGAAGIEHTAFHNLRHSVATLLLQAGENIKTIQNLLGHADIETTLNDYSHVLEEMKKTQADKLDAIFKEVLPEALPTNESISIPDSHSLS